ncbi:hypothetical protein B484DRAFT_410532 [Ochromonadaceae sp. CCMP2298]|nr:hypothetical protein B484DRAFT_410532 [Ochromonadaceae sp. CCMP2298]
MQRTKLRAVLPLAKLVFRSSSLGSVHCANHTLPLTEYLSEAEMQDWPWHYGDFRRQNDLAREVMRTQGHYLDIEAPSTMRAGNTPT